MRRGLIAAALLLAACSSDDDGGAVEATTSTTAAASSTTSTTGAPTTTTTCPAPSGGPALATVDLDGDGVDERWRPAGSGASVEIVELHRLDGCDEVAVTLEGTPAQFAVGGTVLLLQGVRCEGRRVVHLGATSEDGERYVTLDVVYELRDGELVRVDDRAGELTAADPELADYASFEC